jgi:head-tail adaptor
MSYSTLLNITCTKQTLTETQSATGKITKTWVNTTTGIKCRLDQAKGQEFNTVTGKMAKATHTLFLLKSAGLMDEKTNRIVIGSNIYDILMVSDAGGHSHHYELLLERVY